MTTYYVSPDGNDANNGLGPDASHATNKPKLTLKNILVTASQAGPGDVAYIAPGFYKGENCTPIAAVGSAGSPLFLIGDPMNMQGFKDGSGVLRAPGICWVSTRGAADGMDVENSSTANLYALATNGVKGLTFRNLVLEADPLNGNICAINWNSVSTITFEDCRLIGAAVFQGSGGTPAANRNFVVSRCELFGIALLSTNISGAPSTADIDLGVYLQDSYLYGSRIGSIALSASGGNLAGGVYITGNMVFASGSQFLQTTAGRVSTVTPIKLKGNIIFTTNLFVSAGTAGQVIDDGYNQEFCGVDNTNYTRAGTSVRVPAALFHTPILVKWGLASLLDELFTWTKDMPDTQRQSGMTLTTADFRNLTVRPWGTGPSVGPKESMEYAQDTGSQITGGGTNSLKISGAGIVGPFFAQVGAVATTLSVKTKSSSYGGTNYPRLILDPNPAIGYAGESIAATSASEETLTSASFTPTAKGVIRYWLESRSTSGTSATYFDRVTAA